ncbi:TetR/AcrR family transcriptional regulator [Nocardioides antri]|nr:TetR/AcrR family transcriptional regulator [Nocardioides antri]
MTTHASPPATADGRSTRWDDHKAERRERILDAAIDLVARDGGAVAVRDIADAAQVPRSVVYRIFRDRDDLDEQLRTEIVVRLMDVMAPKLAPSGTVHEALTDAVTTYVDWVAGHPLLHQFLGTGSTKRRTTGSRVVTGTRTAIARHLTTLLQTAAAKTGADPTVAEPVAFGVVGLIDGAVNRWVHTDPAERAAVDVLASLLTESVWAVLQSQATGLGIRLTRRTRVSALL